MESKENLNKIFEAAREQKKEIAKDDDLELDYETKLILIDQKSHKIMEKITKIENKTEKYADDAEKLEKLYKEHEKLMDQYGKIQKMTKIESDITKIPTEN